MAEIHLKGKSIHTIGNLPNGRAPDFRLVDKNLKDHSLKDFQGKKKLLATVPSLDTETCSIMTKKLNEFAKVHPEIVFLTVSTDLPFAQKRFCDAGHVENVMTLSMMRDKEFGKAYGLLIQDGPIAGILARSIFVIDENDQIVYSELVDEVTTEPDYQKALSYLG